MWIQSPDHTVFHIQTVTSDSHTASVVSKNNTKCLLRARLPVTYSTKTSGVGVCFPETGMTIYGSNARQRTFSTSHIH
jgi:hypothetical protein